MAVRIRRDEVLYCHCTLFPPLSSSRCLPKTEGAGAKLWGSILGELSVYTERKRTTQETQAQLAGAARNGARALGRAVLTPQTSNLPLLRLQACSASSAFLG